MNTVDEIKLVALKHDIAAGVEDFVRGCFQNRTQANVMRLADGVGRPVSIFSAFPRMKVAVIVLVVSQCGAIGSISSDLFQAASAAYTNNDFSRAATLFAQTAAAAPSAGAFQNLGNAEWKNNLPAEAVVAWERALLLNSRSSEVENNLNFARESAQLESPDLTWCEIAARWLPANVWAWIACGSLWFAVGAMMLPGILRRRRSATQQALVALGLGVFLISLPANYGVYTRSKIGFVLRRETPLRLTPTTEAEASTKLAAGEPGRVLRERGNYFLIRTRRMTGWVERNGFTFVTLR